MKKLFFNCILVALAAYVVVITKGAIAGRLPSVRTCPNLPLPSFCINKFDFCKTDADCDLTNYKCCSNGCKKICAYAVEERKSLILNENRNRVRPGNCPVLPIRKFCLDHESNECSNDLECKEYYKCCSNGCTRRCVVSTSRKAIGSASKKINATCPHFPTRSSNCPLDISNQCSADNDCSDQGNSFKCCWDGCRKICLDPSEIQHTDGRGTCPVMRRQTTCNSFQHECIEDKECNRGQKCCSDGCTMKCVNVKDNTESKKNDTAIPNKFRLDDKCPFVARPIRCPVSSLHQCYYNDECPRPLMCCSDGCRNICLDITKDTSLLLCPIVRRPEVCPNIQDKCSSLGHCGRGQKCCNDGCSFRCFGKSGFQPQNEGPLAIKPLISVAEVIFVMDTSDGPRGSEFELQKSFVTSLTRFFDFGPNKVHVAVISSGQTAKVVKPLSPYISHSDLQIYMKPLKQQGRGRNLDKVFETIENVLSSGRQNVSRLVIIFSFGLPSSSVWDIQTSVRRFHEQGVKIFTIGIDVQEDEPQLRALVTRSQDLFTFRSARELENIGAVFSSYIAGRSENAVPKYFAADVFFLVDSSNSVGRDNFSKVQKFILSMARALNAGPKKSRVSIISFGDVVAEVTADFGVLNSISDIGYALEKMIYLGGASRIDRALDKIPKMLDKTRADVCKVALLVTNSHHLYNVNLQKVVLPLRKRGLEIYALVVGGGQVGVRPLGGLTSRNTDVFSAYNYDILPSLVAPITKYIVNGPPPTTAVPATTTRTSTQSSTTAQHHSTTDITTELPGTVLSTTNSPTEAETPEVTTELPIVSTANVPTRAHLSEILTELPTTVSTTTSPTKNPTTTAHVITATDSQTHYAAAAAPEKGSLKPGICPMVSRTGVQCPSNDECDIDQDCAGNKKCCDHYCKLRVCVEPPSKEEERFVNTLHRPGKCPKLKKPDVCEKETQVECNYDVDCSNKNQKCCSDGCNRQCVDAKIPAPVIPVDPPTAFPIRPGNILGRCPPYSPVRNCPKLVQDDCTCSTDCGSGYKCCFDGCKRICRKPAGNECSAQLDIVYLMDTSGSISKSDYRREKQFVKDLARIFRVGRDASQAAVTIYNDDPHELIKLGQHTSPEEFSKAIDDIPYLHGRTRIDKALKSSFETFRNARPNIRKVLVLLTDGRQTQDPDSVPLNISSQPLKNMGVKIYAVGVGQEIDRGELEVIAGSPDAVFTVDSFTALLGESQTIAEKACGDVIAGKICIRGVDLGFIVDSSESITDDDFIKEQNAIKAISDEFVIAPKSTRVGVVVYSSEPQLSIDFDQYTSNLEFNRAVNTLSHMQSHTRLDKALRYAASYLYNKRRQANPAIVIVMTDGKQTPGAGSLTAAVQPLRDLGVRVFAVGVGPKVSRKELREIVERNDDIFTVDSFSQLIKEAKKITERACPAPSETKLPTLTSSTTAAQTTNSFPTTSLTTPTESPSTPNPCTYFLDIIFVLDSSRSMDVRQYIKQKDFVKKLARIFNVGKGSRAAAIIYSDDPILSIDFDLYNTQEGFLGGVDNLEYIMQRTRIDKALKMASQVLKDSRPGFPKAVIIMTDGRQTRDPGYTKLDVAAAPLHEAGARVLVVGIGPAISVDELMKMVRNNTSDIFTVSSFDGLVNATTAVAIKSCQGTVPPYRPDSCSQAFDLAFVMDSSGSVKISNYNKEKSFVKNIAGRFAVGENKVKLALLSFSDWPNSLVAFNSSSSVSIYGFNAAVDSAEYMQGRTRIDRALAAASNLFKLGRRNVPKIMVFMTDGQQSSDPGFIPIDRAVKPLLDQNVQIIVVGIGKNINTSQLYSLASQRGRDVTHVSTFDDLDKLKNSFAQTICRKTEETIQSGAL